MSSKRVATRTDTSHKLPRSSGEQGMTHLFKEHKRIDKEGLFLVETNDEDFRTWTVYLSHDVLRAHDYSSVLPYLKQWSRSSGHDAVIVLELSFPDAFPNEVPFVRVVRPRFKYQTGHVTIGGSLCTPLLTTSGWTPMTIDSLIASIVVNLKEGDARVQLAADWYCSAPFADYTMLEAKEAYKRALVTHGWK